MIYKHQITNFHFMNFIDAGGLAIAVANNFRIDKICNPLY